MGNEYKKNVKILKDNGKKETVLGAKHITHDLQNKISGFARPNKDGGNAIYKAFNINQIKETYEITAELSDEIAEKLNGSGLSNKEDAKNRVVDNFKSTDLLRLKVKDTIRNRVTTNETGFLEQASFEERAADENTSYKITLNFLRAEKQGN